MPRIARKTVVVVASVLGVLVILFSRSMICHLFPTYAFRQITGRPLPSGVLISAYASEMNDALFHTTHYWMLSGSPSALRQIVTGTEFRDSLDDARYSIPDLQKLFGDPRSSTEVVAGYEDDHSGRNRWYCIFTGETNALYAH